ncbi:MerR family transcriptional regulator [Acinetobacter baumannii]|nr:MerR family transcriptional regulator [Acinetobacter baumannii]OIB77606.1 MerR family transcriptional regulator [Acinetobacter baumannii]OIF40608.1 MerR family transcriptional regulator [Acinetobacter baumannii]
MVDFIHNNKDRYGVDAICRILPIAASTYYRTLDLADNPEHRAKRDLHDEHHAEQIKRIWKESSGRYGVRKVWQKLKREGYVIARCTVARLMQKLGIQDVWRGKNKQTTRNRDDQKRADDLVKRNFSADRADPCEAMLLRSVTLRIFKPILAGSTPHLLLMCSHEPLLDGKYLHG